MTLDELLQQNEELKQKVYTARELLIDIREADKTIADDFNLNRFIQILSDVDFSYPMLSTTEQP